MPTYEYRCANGHEFEVFQRISDKPRTKCPECGARATRTISGGAGLIFKGSGFYITDYGKDGKGPRREPEKPEPAKSTDKTEPSSGAAAKSDAPAKKPKKGPKDAT
jgi:putative FmdB family regulatory protein